MPGTSAPARPGRRPHPAVRPLYDGAMVLELAPDLVTGPYELRVDAATDANMKLLGAPLPSHG
jgi:hypothetical protein